MARRRRLPVPASSSSHALDLRIICLYSIFFSKDFFLTGTKSKGAFFFSKDIFLTGTKIKQKDREKEKPYDEQLP
jgi:hypothetical protein